MGILGGTFDPVHRGHVRAAIEVADALGLSRVLMIPAARPPHKPGFEPAPAAHRLAMLELAAREDPRLTPCAIELKRKGPSYTVDTLEELAGKLPGAAFFLILGSDAYREIDTWHRPQRLLELADIVVVRRPGCAGSERREPPVAARALCCYDPAIDGYVHQSGHRIVFQPIQGVEVSATEVRERVARGLPITELTGPEVARYIAQHGLYRRASEHA